MNPRLEKSNMKFFLHHNSDKEIKQVISMNLKACDDDIGWIGEHYIVKVKTENGVETCYVNHDAFQNYCNGKPDVIWKDQPDKDEDLKLDHVVSKHGHSATFVSDQDKKLLSDWKELERKLEIVRHDINIITEENKK